MRLVCLDCGRKVERGRCVCGGSLDPKYEEAGETDGVGIWRYSDLPVDHKDAVSMGEGGTPIVELSGNVGEGVDKFYVKDEGRNPTGSVCDREMSVALSVAANEGVDTVSLYSPGNSGVSAAAYAARAGIDCRVYVPYRAPYDVKAMINVHGGDMQVVRGRLQQARERSEEAGLYSVSSFDTPYRHDALKTVAYEIIRVLKPDHVICPVGDGTLYMGLDKALPQDVSLHAVQPEGCAPIVKTYISGKPGLSVSPDTVVGELEDPDPPGDRYVLKALENRGDAVMVSDSDVLETALQAAGCGVELSLEGAVAVAGCSELGVGGTVVAVNPSMGRFYADALRNRIMYHGE